MEQGQILGQLRVNAPWSFYLHIPFCAVRCGYCDFNTYVNDFGPGADRATFADSLIREIDLVAETFARNGQQPQPLHTVFFGGGTPTQLPTAELVRVLAHLRATFGLVAGAEVSTEANPDSLSRAGVEELAAGGFTRISVGMQSSVPAVLRTLERTHHPEQIPLVGEWIRAAGLDFSLDLIYGTPGESRADWQSSLTAALACSPDHISAYSLVIEPGTKMGAALARGVIAAPDSDDCADKYLLADELLAQAGYHWYEISNFARQSDLDAPLESWRHASQHNLAYWRNWDWWGAGPGAHSHLGTLRFWNIKHPGRYAQQLATQLPIAGYEELTPVDQQVEQVMLALRTRSGISLSELNETSLVSAKRLLDEGLFVETAWEMGRAVLTLRGRLLADYVTRELLNF